MADSSGINPLTPHNKQMYEQEYKHAADLFQRSFHESIEAQEVHKKAAFEEVMDRSLKILNETARALKRDDLLKQNEKIAKDYENYRSSNTKELQQQLEEDIEKARQAFT